MPVGDSRFASPDPVVSTSPNKIQTQGAQEVLASVQHTPVTRTPGPRRAGLGLLQNRWAQLYRAGRGPETWVTVGMGSALKAHLGEDPKTAGLQMSQQEISNPRPFLVGSLSPGLQAEAVLVAVLRNNKGPEGGWGLWEHHQVGM